MDKELKCDFYLGDKVYTPIKKMNYNELNGFKEELKNVILFGKWYWQSNALKTIVRPYKKYILTGEPYCVSNWFILFFAKILGKEVYLWSHGWYGDESKLKKIIKKAFFNLSTKTLLYGNYSIDLMIKEGIPAHKLLSIYNSLDYDNQLAMRENSLDSQVYYEHFRNSDPVLIYIGRIQKIKRLDILIEAVKLLNEGNVPCNLVIIGKETDEFSLHDQVKQLNIEERVWFYGECYSEENLSELIWNASISITPGNIGLTVMHSFVYGTPVITHNNFASHGPEFEAVEPGVTGDFFKEGDLMDLKRVVEKWIFFQKSNRGDVRKNCFRVIDEKYNPHVQIEIFKELLKPNN